MLPYLFTASILLFVFALGYYLFLRQGPGLPLRRRVILLGIAGVLLLPLCPSPTLPESVKTTEPTAVMLTNWQGDEMGRSMVAIGYALAQDNSSSLLEDAYVYIALLSPVDWIVIIYSLVTLLFLLRTLLGLRSLYLIHKRSRSSGTPGLRLLPGTGEAFTFGKTVYLSESVFYAADADVILEHEQTHARELHTFDALAIELFRAFLWFHPLAWWIREQTLLNLEYLADAAVLRAGYDKRDYQLSLVAHQQGVDFRTSLLPQFAAKGLKRRIKMMGFRAGSQVRSLVATAGLIFCAFTAFAFTNGKAEPSGNFGSDDVVKTEVSSLADGEEREYNIYFRRLPTPGEVDALSQPLKEYEQLSLMLYHDCIEPDNIFTFAHNTGSNQIGGQVNMKPGELHSNYYRFQFKMDGKGYQGTSTFRPQSLPDNAPEADILMNIDGKWVQMTSNDKQAFTPENLTAAPLQAQLHCQLGLTAENKDSYNVTTFTKSDLNIANRTYGKGLIAGFIMGMISPEPPHTYDYDRAIGIPQLYFSGTEEIPEDDFLDFVQQENQRLTVAIRMDGPEDLVVLRLDPAPNQ